MMMEKIVLRKFRHKKK